MAEAPVEEPTSNTPYNFDLKIDTQVSTLLRKASTPKFKLEVRSVFGWTDIDEDLLPTTPKRRDLTEHQKGLPHLPVPDLQETCDLLLKSCEPVLTAEEFETTKRVTEEFRKEGGHGEKLQEILKQYEATCDSPSWLEPWWDAAYVVPRDPVAININYFFCWEDDPDCAKNNQMGKVSGSVSPRNETQFLELLIGRAASLLDGAVNFLVDMRAGKVGGLWTQLFQ